MIILDPKKLDQYLKLIAQGFQRSPWVVFLTLSGILLLILVAVIFHLLAKKHRTRQRLLKSKAEFNSIIDGCALGDIDRHHLEAMAELHKRKTERARVLASPVLFTAYAREMMAAGTMDERTAARLRFKLGLHHKNNSGIYSSTVEIKENQFVLLKQKKVGTFPGRVSAVDENGLTVSSRARPQAGESVLLISKQPSGLYFAVLKTSRQLPESSVLLFHSENLQRVQKRSFFRKNIALPVRVTINNGAPFQALLLDLGGGGARIRRRGEEVQMGDALEIQFVLEEPVKLRARVTRVDKNSYSLEFGTLREAERDKILRYVLQ